VKKVSLLLSTILALTAVAPLPAAEEAGEELVTMIVDLVKDKDRDMRAVGLQQIREEAKGAAATRRFAALLPNIAPDAQTVLLDALGQRGDKAARPAVLGMLQNTDEQVRAAAVRALGTLGETADVAVLAQSLATPGPQQTAARASLARLQGTDVIAAIVAEYRRAKPEVQAELLGVLAAREAKECVPLVFQATEDADPEVATAALAALKALADPTHATAIVRLLKSAKSEAQQWKAEQALVAVCAKGSESCVAPILAGMTDASPTATAGLLRALARAGGDKALSAVVAAAKDSRPEVGPEAVRLLCGWPDKSAVTHMAALAKDGQPLRNNVLAVQGLIRLASPVKDRAADVGLLGDAMKLARRPDEKRRVLGVLRDVATRDSLALAVAALDDPALRDDASRAVTAIAEKLPEADQAVGRAALEKAKKASP
jgi:HEAT repeat protein